MSKSLLPINASQLLKDLESSSLKATSLEALNRYVTNPDLAPNNILPWLAWAVSVDDWSDNWPKVIKREMIKNSISLHQIKGTKRAIQKALEIIGVAGEIALWWELNPRMTPHSFNITAYLNDNINEGADVIIGLDTQQKLINLIENVKPARSHFNFKLGARFESQISYGVSSKIKQFVNLSFVSELPKFRSESLIFTKIKTSLYKQVNLHG
jgi:phage tail P2-like protein